MPLSNEQKPHKEIFFVESENSQRLDSFISEKLDVSRSQLKHLNIVCYVNDVEKKLSHNIKLGDKIEIKNIDIKDKSDTSEIEAENIALEIVYEDESIIIVNKQEGMSVHCSAQETSGTLANAMLYHVKDFNFWQDKSRVGIIHRLDKDTSGLLIVGKNPKVIENIQAQFKDRSVEKIYHAIIIGNMRAQTEIIDLPIGRHPKYRKKMCVNKNGRNAITEYEVIETFDKEKYSLLKINLHTGRTHQIRVHLSYKGNPVVGDKIYSKSSDNYSRLMLHAKSITFNHPTTGKRMSFDSVYPKSFQDFLDKISYKA